MSGTIQQHADACGCTVQKFIDWVTAQFTSPTRPGKEHSEWVKAHTPEESAERYFEDHPRERRIRQKRLQPLDYIGNPRYTNYSL